MKRIILRADIGETQAERKKKFTDGLEAGITEFILRGEDRCFESLGSIRAYYAPEIAVIDSRESAKKALSDAKNEIFVEFRGRWKVIPLENILAEASSKGIAVIAVVKDADEAELFLNTLEIGVDGIITDNPGIFFEKYDMTTLTEVIVESVKPVGNGDRVCVDTCSMMSPGEGMLVGSQSNCLILVQSECEVNGYVEPRPFRVNAGAVHAYIMTEDGTKYLSELESGDKVTICGRDGKCRNAAIGRCKIENRPMLMVSVTSEEKKYSIMLQNAETVRLVTRSGSVSVSELKKGDMVLAHTDNRGRHFGMPVGETVREI